MHSYLDVSSFEFSGVFLCVSTHRIVVEAAFFETLSVSTLHRDSDLSLITDSGQLVSMSDSGFSSGNLRTFFY